MLDLAPIRRRSRRAAAALAALGVVAGTLLTAEPAAAAVTGSLTVDHDGRPDIGDMVTISVADADLNTNPAVAETTNEIAANSPLGPLSSIGNLVLTETGVNTGVFEATLKLAEATDAGADPPELGVLVGTPAQVVYTDAATDGGDPALDVEVLQVGVWVDCGGPVTSECIDTFQVDPDGLGGGAGFGDPAAAVSLVVWLDDGTLQIQVTCTSVETNADAYDLTEAGCGMTTASVVQVVVDVGTLDAVAFVSTGDISSYSFDESTDLLTFEASPTPSSWLFAGCSLAGCGDDTTEADVDYGGMLIGAASNLDVPELADDVEFQAFRAAARGSWIATNAQSFSPPTFDAATSSFQFDLAAPHLRFGGGVNTGFFKAFLPDALLTDVFGISDLSTVAAEIEVQRTDGAVTTAVAPTISAATGGVRVDLASFDFSTPKFAIRPAASDHTPDPGGGGGSSPPVGPAPVVTIPVPPATEEGRSLVTVATSAGAVELTLLGGDGDGTVTVAVTSSASLADTDAAGLTLLSTAFEVESEGVSFTRAEVCFPYHANEVAAAGVAEPNLALFHFPDNGGREVITTTVDTTDDVICGMTDGFSPFAIGVLDTERVAGDNRAATAAALSASRFEPGVDVAYVVRQDGFADALSAGPAAAAERAPLLLVGDDISPETAAELERLRPDRIVVVGGTEAVSATMIAELGGLTAGAVERIAGVDRYDTAARVAMETFAPAGTVYIAAGTDFPDGLAAGAAAARAGGALLLTERDALPGATAAALAALRPGQIVVVGGTAAVGASVEAALHGFAEDVDRVAGADRYGTAAAVARAVLEVGGVVAVATGKNFPDALAVVPVAAIDGAALLLVGDDISVNTDSALRALQPAAITVVGGRRAVSNAVELELAAFLPD